MTFCNQCGSQITNESDRFCPKCGAPARSETRHMGVEQVDTTEISPVPAAGAAASQDPHVPIASIVLVGVGLVLLAFGSANFPSFFTHVVLTRLIYAAFGVGFVLLGVASLVAIGWATSRSLGTSAILIGVGLVLSGTFNLAIAIGSREISGYFNFPSNTVQNVTSAIAVGGWVIAAVGVFMTLRKATS